MKKLFFLSVACSLLLFYSCENAPNIMDGNTSEEKDTYTLAKKVKPAPSVEATIVWLAIDDIPLIKNNVVQPLSGLELDFNTNSYDIDYEVYHPEGVNNVQIKTWCDIIPNGSQWPLDGLLENSGYIDVDDPSSSEGTINWDGTITPDSWDSYRDGVPYKLFDQLATTTHVPDYTAQPDSYGLTIMVESKGKIPSFTFKKSNTFLVLAEELDNTFHVQDVEINEVRGKTKAIIKVVDDDGNGVDGAWVFGYWDGITDYYKGITGIGGVVEIAGKRSPKFSVKSVEKAGWVYNPWSNADPLWDWPEVEPFGVLVK